MWHSIYQNALGLRISLPQLRPFYGSHLFFVAERISHLFGTEPFGGAPFVACVPRGDSSRRARVRICGALVPRVYLRRKHLHLFYGVRLYGGDRRIFVIFARSFGARRAFGVCGRTRLCPSARFLLLQGEFLGGGKGFSRVSRPRPCRMLCGNAAACNLFHPIGLLL